MKITGSLIVCSAAAAFTAAALLVNPTPSRPASVAAGPVADATAGVSGVSPTLSIQGFAFTALTAHPGETVVVQNLDPEAHTASATDGSFDTGVVASGTAVSVVAPSATGVYPFVCAIHPSMTGQLTVVA